MIDGRSSFLNMVVHMKPVDDNSKIVGLLSLLGELLPKKIVSLTVSLKVELNLYLKQVERKGIRYRPRVKTTLSGRIKTYF